MFYEPENLQYTEDVSTVLFQGKPVTLTERTPVFTPEQREKRKKEIEQTLYRIFSNYADHAETPKKAA